MKTVHILFSAIGSCVMLCAQASIIDTGSTNVHGFTVVMGKSGQQADMRFQDGTTQKMKLEKDLCARFRKDLAAAGALDALPKGRCMKSVSFGSSLFVEVNGVRSPDLNCPQYDERTKALKRDVADIMAAARAVVPREKLQRHLAY